jgi:superfamily II DNA/RNA helicase
VAELSRAGSLKTHNTDMLVLDEVDELQSDNMLEDLDRITQHTGKRLAHGRQTVRAQCEASTNIACLLGSAWMNYGTNFLLTAWKHDGINYPLTTYRILW